MAFRKDGLLYTCKEEYIAESTIDHQLKRNKRHHISKNIGMDLINYVKYEERKGCLKWDP